jgi:hypothetical protein
MTKQTTLGESQITPSDTISVELIAPDSMPAIVKITWPLQPTVCDPRRFPEIAATIARLFAQAATTSTQIRARRRL